MPTPAATAHPFVSAPMIQTAFNVGTAALTFVAVLAVAAATWLLVPRAVLYGRLRESQARCAELQGALGALAPSMAEMRVDLLAVRTDLAAARGELETMKSVQAESAVWIASVIVESRKRGATIPDPPPSIKAAVDRAVEAREREHVAAQQGAAGVVPS